MIQKFFTRNLAEKVAEEKNASGQVYYLRHGEAGRPDYKAVKYMDGYAVKVTYCFYAGTFNAPKNHLLTTEEI